MLEQTTQIRTTRKRWRYSMIGIFIVTICFTFVKLHLKGGESLAFKSARLSKGLTLVEASEAIGVTAQAISLWETEKTMPSAALLPKIAEVYGVTIDALFKAERGDGNV